MLVKTFLSLYANIFLDLTVVSAPSSPSNLSTVTLVGSDNSNSEHQEGKGKLGDKEKADADKREDEEEEKDPETPKVKTFQESLYKDLDDDDDEQEGLRDLDNDDNKNDDAFDQDNSEESNQELEHLYSRLEEDDDPFDYKSRDTRRGSMKKLNEVGTKPIKDEEEEIKRKRSVDESSSSKGHVSKKESSSFFHKEPKKGGSNKKEKEELKKSDSKPERIAGRFSDGFLTVENKGRRQRSKSAERRSRPVFRRKGSEGFIVTSEMKRKGSDGKF